MPLHGAYSALCTGWACGRASDKCMGSHRYALFSCTESSGGGPGAMEATHLGAWMAGRNEAEFDDAMDILSTAQTS